MIRDDEFRNGNSDFVGSPNETFVPVELDECIEMRAGFAERLTRVFMDINYKKVCKDTKENYPKLLEWEVAKEVVDLKAVLDNEELRKSLEDWFIAMCHQNWIYGYFNADEIHYFLTKSILPDAAHDFPQSVIGFSSFYFEWDTITGGKGIRYIDLIKGCCDMFGYKLNQPKTIRNKIGRILQMQDSSVLFKLDKYFNSETNEYDEFLYTHNWKAGRGTVC